MNRCTFPVTAAIIVACLSCGCEQQCLNGVPARVDSDCDGFADDPENEYGLRADNCDGFYNPDQSDRDDDGLGDPCDPCPSDPGIACEDSDNDGLLNTSDNCPTVANPDQQDGDGDGVGMRATIAVRSRTLTRATPTRTRPATRAKSRATTR
jgi:hypothetical protein